MLIAQLLDDEIKEEVAPVLGEETSETDILVGLLDDEADTLCGFLGAESVPDGERGHALAIRFLKVAGPWENKGGERVLLRFLQDLAADLECSAVFFSEVFPEEQGELQELIRNLGFFAEDAQLPLYEFSLSDVSVRKQKTELACVTLADLTEKQWADFVRDTDGYDFELTAPDGYEKNLSVFLADDDGNVQAGLLFTMREEALFAEAVAAYGSDEAGLINDLVLWAREGAKKRLAPGTKVRIFLPAKRVYHDLLMEVTGKKAQKIGSLINYTYEVPVY